ncbi:4-hydroxyphenylpyruvate dioxygenase [Streptomyces sp. 5-8]|uniref:4-hydroxyphenylpyruvate dioxygenase n=1 Tax=Streptomyces musisoli TaxID=2802280 RepID=A0ABS1PDV7_9ACTN|nr:4-hydroxyphenylpyruvate dioxygenase [Streptomyces musisoli]MBL1110444.1 4-hydroxyphenylpyruvate dioxygenase [Streptomyces musisoli]
MQYSPAGEGVRLDHVEFFVADAAAHAATMVDQFGFRACGDTGPGEDGPSRSVAVRQGDAAIVFTQGTAEEHPAAVYVDRHGDGVGGITLRVDDVRAVFAHAVANGATVVEEPVDLADDVVATTAVIGGFGDVVHRLVQPAPAADPRGVLLPGFRAVSGAEAAASAERGIVHGIDHFAVCLAADGLTPAVEFYRRALGLREIFEERILVGGQAMISKVVQNAARDVTFTLIEPDLTAQPGQIDAFLKDHDGAGVQHIALAARNIVGTVADLTGRGIGFLTTPAAYYDMLGDRLSPRAYTVEQLRELGILADEDHGGQLFQLFAKSTHPRRTFFWEVIERLGAKTFGTRNIKALYEAVARDQEQVHPAPGGGRA